MKILVKSVVVCVTNFCMLFFLQWLYDNMPGLEAGSISKYDIEIWWDTFNSGNMLFYLMITAELSGGLYLIYEVTTRFAKNRVKYMLAGIIGVICVFLQIRIYWILIPNQCYGYEGSNLETSFTTIYGNSAAATNFWVGYACILFCAGLFLNRLEVLVQNKKQKIICHQVCFREKGFHRLLYIGVPYAILHTGSGYLVDIVGLNIKTIYILFSVVFIINIYLIKVRQAITLNKYYQSIERNERQYLVIVDESPFLQKSFFTEQLCKSEVLSSFKKKGIWFVPREMELLSDNYIKLDVLDNWMFVRSKAQKERVFSTMCSLKGTFNLVFSNHLMKHLPINYDGQYDSLEELFDAIEHLMNYIDYKVVIGNRLRQMDLISSKNANAISGVLLRFKLKIGSITDEFLCFDYAVKWLEYVNYLFAVISFSKNKQRVSDCEGSIERATFGTWRNIVKCNTLADKKLSLIMNRECEDVVFHEFENLWKDITSNHYGFKRYTVANLLDGANKLRNYTRGHGVFTFDFSQSMNIRLIKILVFLVNHLIEYLDSADNLDNLENLGWLMYMEETPYFLYSVDKEHKEYSYMSFEQGNIISLPIDRVIE